MFWFTLVVRPRTVGACGLPLDRGVRFRPLFAEIIAGAASSKYLAIPLAYTSLDSLEFHSQPVRALLADRRASISVPCGEHFHGEASNTAFCHVILFIYVT